MEGGAIEPQCLLVLQVKAQVNFTDRFINSMAYSPDYQTLAVGYARALHKKVVAQTGMVCGFACRMLTPIVHLMKRHEVALLNCFLHNRNMARPKLPKVSQNLGD